MNARPNVVLAVVAGTVVALGILAGFLTATRPAPQIDPATPDGVVHLYVSALVDGDDTEALTHLDPSLGCSDDELRYGPVRTSFVIVDTRIDGDRAAVVADLSEYSGALSSWDHREEFVLTRTEAGQWVITDHPWPFYSC